MLPPGTLALLDEPAADPLDHAAAAFASASKSAATRRAYLSGLRYFEAWCRLDSSSALPATPPTVARYVTFLAGLGRSVSTIDQRVAAIAFAHRLDGHDSPTTSETVRTVLAGTQPFGGRRWWLICPDSGVRTSTLYMPDGAARFASRQVHRLGYRTQRLGDRGRAEERQVAALAALGGEAQAGGSIPDRPKGMRRDTYQRLLERARGGQGDQSFGSFGSP